MTETLELARDIMQGTNNLSWVPSIDGMSEPNYATSLCGRSHGSETESRLLSFRKSIDLLMMPLLSPCNFREHLQAKLTIVSSTT